MSVARPLDSILLRRAAHLRARGHDWEVIAAALGTPGNLLERMALAAPDVWAEHLTDGLAAAQAEAFAVCLKMLVTQMQSDDWKTARAAGELLVKLHTANLRHRAKERAEAAVEVVEPPVMPQVEVPAGGTRNASDGVAQPVARAPGSSGATPVSGAEAPGHGVPGSNNPPPHDPPVGMSGVHKKILTAFLKPSG